MFSLVLITEAASGGVLSLACNFIKKEILTPVLSCQFCEISKNTVFTEHLRVAASEHFIERHNYKVFHVYFVLSKLLPYCRKRKLQ